MFTDMVGYTALMQQDEQTASTLRRKHRRVLDRLVAEHSGKTLQYFGDGTLTVFDSAIEAVLCAIAIQGELQTDPQVPLRIGLSLGDVAYDDDGIYGDGVNLASRIESISVAGSVLVSETIFREVRNQPTISCERLGLFKFKNVQQPTDVYAVTNAGLVVPDRAHVDGKLDKMPENSLAILPLANLTNDPKHDCFCDGIAEELINTLAPVDGLAVISRTSTFKFRNTAEDPQTIGNKLGVSHVLEGSVRCDDETVRVSVRLVDATNGFQIWSDVFDHTLAHVLDVQAEIASNLLRHIQESIGTAPRQDRSVETSTTDGEAYNHFLRGKYYWNKWTPDATLKAIDSFQAALEIDPDYSETLCALSNCYTFLGSCGQLQPALAFGKAYEYVLAALERDANSATAHHAIATLKFMYQWDWEGAEASFRKALDLHLDSADFHQTYATFLAAVGRFDEAIERMKRANRLDPLSLSVLSHLGDLYVFARDFDKALECYDEVLELDPTFRTALESKGVGLFAAGRKEECVAPLAEYRRLSPDPMRGVTVPGMIHAMLGDTAYAHECLALIERRHEQNPEQSVQIDLALVNIGLGEYARATECLLRACKDKTGVACLGLIYIFRCSVFEDFHRYPGFRQIESVTGLTAEPSGSHSRA